MNFGSSRRGLGRGQAQALYLIPVGRPGKVEAGGRSLGQKRQGIVVGNSKCFEAGSGE